MLTPSDGADNQPTTVELIWQAVSEAATYEVQLSTSQNFSAMLITDEKVARLYRLGLKDSSQFGEDQAVQFDALMITVFRDFQNTFQQYRISQLDEDEWEVFARNIL